MNSTNRHARQNSLKPLLTNYWGARVMAQLLYLEEVNTVHGGMFAALLDDLSDQLARVFETDGAVTKQSALAIEQAMAPASALCKAVTVSCVGHAHIDMNWMWRFDETAMITVDTFRTMLQLMREYPEFTFAQSQASVYKIVEDYAPEMLPEIRERICEGRWEVTASHWVETDKNMPNGESLTRHLLYTRQYLKKLLGLSDGQFCIDFEPDTFGHGANVPEILRSGGVKYMYHCRGYSGHHLYRWKAPSGEKVTVFREPTWYNETITTESFLHVPSFCDKNGIDRLLHVYGVGDHGGGATRRDIERIMDYAAWPCMPNLKFGRYTDFFKYIETLDLPVVEHELNFIFDGCYTSQSRIKKANRVAEKALYEAELYNSISHQLGAYPYDAGAFAAGWKNVLFNHFHDILPGSGTIDTREYALGLFQETMAGAGTRISAALRAISAQINTQALLPEPPLPKDSVAEGAGDGFGVRDDFKYTLSSPVGGKKRLFVLYNPNQTELDCVTPLDVWDWDGDLSKLKITDENGQILEHELIDRRQNHYWGHDHFRVNVLCEIPAFGWRTVLLEEAAVPGPVRLANDPRNDIPADYILENAHVKAVFDPQSAALISFIDKKTGREYINSQPGGLLRYIEEDTLHGMTSWRVGRYRSDEAAGGIQNLRIERGNLTSRLCFGASVKNSRLDVCVTLGKNARYLTYGVSCDWREFGVPDERVPQLAFRVPLAYGCEKFIQDNAFGLIERSPRDGDVPAQSFSFAPLGESGLMLSCDSKYGFRCAGNAMSVSLIRGSYDPDPTPEIYTHRFHINVGIVENARQRLAETALRLNQPAIAVAVGSQAGELPLCGSFARIAEGKAVVSSVKTAEDGGGLIVRLYDVSGKSGDVTLGFFRPIKSMRYVDAHENELGRVDGDKIHCKANSVTAVKITF